MTFIKGLPKLIIFLLLMVAGNLLIFTVMRLIFWGVFNNPNDALPIDVLLKSFYLGFKFDLRLILLMNLPILIISWIGPINMFKTLFGRRLWVFYLIIVNLIALLFYLTDFGHYAYLKTRLNATVLRYLYNPLISLEMIWESYPVVWGILGIILFAFLYGYAVRWLIISLNNNFTLSLAKWKRVLAIILTVLFFMAGIYGKFSYYPLRWCDAFFTDHPFASSLGLNPVLFFFDTIKNREKTYDIEEVKKHYDLISGYLGITKPDKEKLNFVRVINKTKKVSTRPNVVVVFLESFAFYRTGIFGNPLNPTPNFDNMARDSLLFRRFYVPSVGTARSVFAAITGIPDVESSDTSTHNPIIINQHTIINVFKGYEKFYFLGGSASWRNIRGFLNYSIPGIHIYEEGSYASPRVDVWGISDLNLFEESNQVLRKMGDKPFFAIIQTSGSHRPFTIPDDNRGFNTVSVTNDELKISGYDSLAEFNAFRFMDHSIGFFINTIKKEEYFKNTIFVFFGDHGIGGNAQHMPKAEEQLRLTYFHVAFLIYAPGLIPEGRTYDKIASEVDILPTIAALTSTPYINTTFGRDLFDTILDAERYAFTISDQTSIPEIGILSDRFYFLMNADGSNKRLHIYNSENPRENVSSHYPQEALEMERLCRAYYETSKYFIYHNSPGRYLQMH